LQARNAELKNRIAEYEIGFADSVVKNEEENSLMFWVNMITRTNEEIMANDIEARRLKLVIANWGK
jgi:hypothetical protein